MVDGSTVQSPAGDENPLKHDPGRMAELADARDLKSRIE